MIGVLHLLPAVGVIMSTVVALAGLAAAETVSDESGPIDAAVVRTFWLLLALLMFCGSVSLA